MADLTQEVKALAQEKGAHLVGVASADRFTAAPRGHNPQDLLPGAKSVIVIGMQFFQSVLRADLMGLESQLIPKGHQMGHLGYVQEHVYQYLYDVNNWRLNWMGVDLAHLLTTRGHDALPLDSGKGFSFHLQNLRLDPYDTSGFPGERYSFFSHRHAAVLAGLGDLGMNNLLITPRYGPRISLNSVITTAELEPDPVIQERVCLGEECMLCLRSKPCFGELYDLEMDGRRFKLARFRGCKPGLGPNDADTPNICRRGGWGTLPYTRYCVGICPVGKDRG